MSFNPRQDIGSPSFVYDRVYPSYKELKQEESKDGVTIGRYVIILYERQIVNNHIDITPPTGEIGYWDTAIFQKQYNLTNGEYYQFITFLGVFGDIPPEANTIILVDRYKNLTYSTQENDSWIGIDTTGAEPKLTHKKIENTSGYDLYEATITDISNGIRITYPSFKIDSKGHMIYVGSKSTEATNIASLSVGTF